MLQQQQQRAGVAGPGMEHDPEQILKDKFLVKQHIRQTVLQRTSSKSHMENVDEETEAKLAQVIYKVKVTSCGRATFSYSAVKPPFDITFPLVIGLH